MFFTRKDHIKCMCMHSRFVLAAYRVVDGHYKGRTFFCLKENVEVLCQADFCAVHALRDPFVMKLVVQLQQEQRLFFIIMDM